MYRIAAIVLVPTVVGSAAAAQVPRLTPVTSFGCDACAGPTLFSSVQAVGVAADGSILVADTDRPMVRRFNTDGTFLGGFGRSGQGPGELLLPIAIGALGESIVVADLRNQAITTYDPAGAVKGTHRLNGLPTLAAFPPNGGAPIVAVTQFTGPEVSLLRFDGDSVRPLRRVTAPLFPERPEFNFDMVCVAVARDGSFAVGDGIGAYRIILFNADGSQRHVIHRDIPRARLSAAEIRALAAQRERNMERARQRAAAESPSGFTSPPIPEERNFFSYGALAFDEQGRLWVRVDRATGRNDVRRL